MNNFFKKLSFLFLSAFFLFAPFLSFAAGLVPCGGSGEPQCSIACFYVMINNIISFLLQWVVFPLTATAFMVAGILLVAGGSEKSISMGKEILKGTIIGVLIAFAAVSIINLILGNLLQQGSTYWPWDRFPYGSCG